MEKEKSKIAYLAGLISGDGHLESKTNRVIIFSSSRNFSNFIVKIVKELGFNPSIFFDLAGNEWKVAVHSNRLQNILIENFGLVKGNKTLTMNIPKLDKLDIKYFIAGLFDAEGYFELDKQRYYRIRLSMKHRKMIIFLYKQLIKLGYNPTMFYKADGANVVCLNRQKEVRRFKSEFNLFHPKWLLIK